MAGSSFPLANAPVNYRLITVLLNTTYPTFLTTADQAGIVYTDDQGSASISFPVNINENLTYALITYAHLGGLAGVGCFQHVSSISTGIVPLVGSLSAKTVYLAHSADVPNTATSVEDLTYNATFVFANENFELQVAQLENSTGDSAVRGRL